MSNTQTALDINGKKSISSGMGTNLDSYAKSIDQIGVASGDIGQIWNGSRASRFISQLEAFLPGLTIGYNVLEKSKNDFDVQTSNIVETDNS